MNRPAELVRKSPELRSVFAMCPLAVGAVFGASEDDKGEDIESGDGEEQGNVAEADGYLRQYETGPDGGKRLGAEGERSGADETGKQGGGGRAQVGQDADDERGQTSVATTAGCAASGDIFGGLVKPRGKRVGTGSVMRALCGRESMAS